MLLLSVSCFTVTAAVLWPTRAVDADLWFPASQRVEQHCAQLEERGGGKHGRGRSAAGR